MRTEAANLRLSEVRELDLFQRVRHQPFDIIFSSPDVARIAERNDFGQTVLHEAVARRRVDVSHELIRRGVDLDAQDESGNTALHFAAEQLMSLVAESIISAGGSVSLANAYGNQPLWTAVFNARGEYSVVEVLLLHGADPTHRNVHGRSPLDVAREIGDEHLVNLLQLAAAKRSRSGDQ